MYVRAQPVPKANMDQVDVEYVRLQIQRGRTHAEISKDLKDQNPTKKGLSERSVRRFCHLHNLHYRCRLTQRQLDDEVRKRVGQVTFYSLVVRPSLDMQLGAYLT